MLKSVKIREINTEPLCCEPILRRTPNGELICVVQSGGNCEPAPENRVYVFHSRDDGETWFGGESIYPEDGQAVYCTEVSVLGNEITAYLTIHSGHFLDWKCLMMKSFDSGYNWHNGGTPPHLPEYTFIRGTIVTSDNRIIIPYHNYPVTREAHDRALASDAEVKGVWLTNPDYCESGVLISDDQGMHYERYSACRMPIGNNGWIWSEPTIVELSDGRISMLMRKCGSGWLWRCDSTDGGKSWGEVINTGIPNPSNKPKLLKLDNGRIALIHTPNNEGMENGHWGRRFPLALWISDDNMETWTDKNVLTDFPGSYSYSDGFYEDGHIRFTIEHNRHTVLYFDVEV